MIKANFNTYNNYVTDSLYQWDVNQDLVINGLNLSVAPEIHFANADMDRAIVRQATLEGGVVTVRIPNSLLQAALTIKAYVGIYEDDTFKVIETIEIPVIAKARPTDYTFEDSNNEIYSFKALENAIANMVTKAETSGINARIDNIIAHNNDTESNTELIDMRLGADGNIYATAGEAVRRQFEKVKGDLYIAHEDILNDGTINVVVADTLEITDITNTLTWISGSYIGHNGTYVTSGDGRYSNIITLNAGEAIRVTVAADRTTNYALLSKWSEDGSTFVSCIQQAKGDTSVETVEYIATETEYLRVCYHYYFTVTVGKVQPLVETYTVDNTECSQINGKNIVDKKTRELAEGLKALHIFENLYSAEYNVEGKWVNNGGNIADAETYTYTSVPVDGGKYVYLCYNTTGVDIRAAHLSAIRFANGETKISHITNIENYVIDGQYMGYKVAKLKVPNNANRIEFNLKSWYDATETMIVSYTDLTSVLTGWKPKIWADKKWACVGDSLTKTSNNRYTTRYYHNYIANATGVNVVNMGEEGTAYAVNGNGGTNNSFYHRIVNVPTDADVVTIFGSFNDFTANLPIGEVGDTELTTVCGYINATIDRLYSVMPTVQLGIITPTPWSLFNMNYAGAVDYVDKLIGICEKRGIPYLDLFRCSNLRPWDATFRQLAYSKDVNGGGTHPDETGNKIIAPRILEFLKTLLIY